MATVSSLILQMSSHPLPTARGPQRHYTEHSFDWQSLFDELDAPSPAPSLRTVARAHAIPPSTLSKHYRDYRSAVSTHNSTRLAVARGEIAGQRDNSRLFSRDEEKQLLRAINKENVHPNKPVVRQLALQIHQGARGEDWSHQRYQITPGTQQTVLCC